MLTFHGRGVAEEVHAVYKPLKLPADHAATVLVHGSQAVPHLGQLSVKIHRYYIYIYQNVEQEQTAVTAYLTL